MAKKMTGRNTGQKGKNGNKNSGSGDFAAQNVELHPDHSPQNFLAYYTGPEGKLQCILFPRKRRISAVLLVYSA